MNYIVELKRGTGKTLLALKRALELHEEKAHGRYRIDTLSPSLLKTVKELSPATLASLHTRFGAPFQILR
jgi:hypothetical protein